MVWEEKKYSRENEIANNMIIAGQIKYIKLNP